MKPSRAEKIFNIFNIAFMIILCITTLYPYLNQLAISFNDGMDTMRGGISVYPRKFVLDNYTTVLLDKSFRSAAFISVMRVIISTFLSLAVIFCAAYGLTRPNLPYKREITLALMIPSYISAGVIPVYMAYRYYHLLNNFLVYILPHMFSFYYMVIVRSFLHELPASIIESAKIDGANEVRIMIGIVLPLSLPVVATVALWCSVGAWNDWTTTLMYVTERSLYPLQYLLMRIIKESSVAQQMAQEAAMTGSDVVIRMTPDSVKAASLIITTLPIIMVYPFLQKYFIKGIALGAVKE